jgi:hypothetical protein
MSLFKKIFRSTKVQPSVETVTSTIITAKEKQAYLVKSYLKVTLKNHGYLTNAQTWWKDKGDFYIIINLQNFSWNTKNDINFCFNIGIGLKSLKKDSSKKPTHFDLTTHQREGSYIGDSQKAMSYRNKNGYLITESTNIEKFITEIKSDFEQEILPKLERLNTIDDCIKFFESVPFWGDQLKRLTNTKSIS